MKIRFKMAFVVLMATFLVSCTQKHSEEAHGHPHDEEAAGLEPLVYTIYSDKSELFVEFKPLVVGTTSKFAAHFTILGDNFLPLTEGKVTLSLITGDSGIRNVADTASSPGIFRLALQPKKAGTGKLIFDIVTKDFTDQIIIDDVPIHANEADALKVQVASTNANEISYSKEQAWKVEFANVTVQRQYFNNVIKTGGQILAAPGDEKILAAQISGIVSYAGSGMMEGSALNAGARLFTINSTETVTSNISTAVQQARQDVATAKAQFERATELAKDRIVSEKELLEAKLRFENAQTNLNNVSVAQNFNQSKQQINAPINGYLKSVFVQNGQFVEAGTPLAMVSNNKSLILQANVSQKHFAALSTIQSANFKMAGSETYYKTQDLNGKIVSIGKSASTHSPFIPISFEINNVGGLIPGATAEVYLKSAPISDALVIPASALIEEMGLYYVYIQTQGELFQKREVKLGANDGLNVQILSGVEEKERVVSKGAYQIKLAVASGSMPAHGHEH
jgi:cobalt-zinc-cadmium efflux system membrane fusion protein